MRGVCRDTAVTGLAAVVAACLPGSRRSVVGIRRNMTLELDENRKKKGKLIKHQKMKVVWANRWQTGARLRRSSQGLQPSRK